MCYYNCVSIVRLHTCLSNGLISTEMSNLSVLQYQRITITLHVKVINVITQFASHTGKQRSPNCIQTTLARPVCFGPKAVAVGVNEAYSDTELMSLAARYIMIGHQSVSPRGTDQT